MGLKLDQRRIWLIAPGEGERLWHEWQRNSEITLGYGTDFGDASLLPDEQAIKARIQQTTGKSNPFNDVRAIQDFTHEMSIGDVVFVKQGRDGLLGIGEVAGPYVYDSSKDEYQHTREVVWLKTGEWTREDLGPVKTLTEITSYDWQRHESLIFDGPPERCWIFQGDPSRYDFQEALNNGTLSTFRVSAHRSNIKPGDKGILWLTGSKRGCYALLEVSSEPFNSDDHEDKNWLSERMAGTHVSVKVTHDFSTHPISAESIQTSPLLMELNIGHPGTNFQASLGQYELLKSMGEFPKVALGEKEQVWLIHAGHHEAGEHGQHWRKYLNEGIVTMSKNVGDLNDFSDKAAIEQALQDLRPANARSSRPSQTALAYEQFSRSMKIGDVVVVRSHQFFVGVGRIKSDYFFDESDSACPHKREIEWLLQGQTWAPPGWTWKKLTEIRKYSRETGSSAGYENWLALANRHFLTPGAFPVQTWWVNQGSSFEPNNPQVWAPKTMSNGNVNRYHRYVQDIKKGDLLVHYSRGIQGFSIAKHDAEARINPFGEGQWEESGFGLDVDFYPLDETVALSVLQGIEGFADELQDLIKTDHPFDKRGEVKQGYMFPFSLAMLVDIQDNISFSFPEPIRGFLRGLEATQESTSSFTDDTTNTMDPQESTSRPAMPTNKIFYGPPGTGKTYHLQSKLIGKYQSKASELSREELLDEYASKMTWADVSAVALIQLQEASISELMEHELVLAKSRISSSKSVRATLWGTILEHVPEECELVNVSQRRNPIFWKNKAGSRSTFTIWSGLDDKELTSYQEMARQLSDVVAPKENATANHFEFVTFHQSFSYEDFVEGIKPVMEDGGDGELRYQIEPGVFKTICNAARRNPSQRYAIFIDEINRGNVASIFGELITLIEPDKRDGQANHLSVKLPYSKEDFSVPSNLDIFGTMNTADRSVEALDTALRRRFEFEEIGPQWRKFSDKVTEGINVGDLLRTINQRIEHLLDKDHCIGHSYFYKVTDFQSLQQVFAKNIIPLLQEYFYGDYGKVGLILGEAFVQARNDGQTSFASFDHPDADLLQEKVVYDLQDPTRVEAEGYRAIYS